MNKSGLGLLNFLTPSEVKQRILVLEDVEYLPRLRGMFPLAELWCAVSDADKAEGFEGLGIKWCFVDFEAERLPLEQKYYDYIMGENVLGNAGNPQDLASGLGLYLKDTGCLLTSFVNIRYWKIIKNLMEGHFYHIASRVYTKDEMGKLLGASFFKDVRLMQGGGSEPPAGLIEHLEQAGFDNSMEDLQTECWLLQAAKAMPEIMELKRLYTPEVRADIATLLRRLEYGIAPDVNAELLWELCQREQIFPAYIASFMREAIIYINDCLRSLSVWQKDAVKREFWQELVTELSALAWNEEKQSYTAWLSDTPLPAFDYKPRELSVKVPAGTKIAFITCVNNEEQYEECVLYLQQLNMPPNVEAEVIAVREAESMCQGYNLGMAQTDAEYKVYLHQDTLLVNKNFVYDILEIFADKSIGALGVIGARSLPASGVWWDGMRIYGDVLHACEPECVVRSDGMSAPEPYIDVEAVDGLLLAVHGDLSWREDLFTGWHFYEISMCKEIQRTGRKVVIPHQERYWCIHMPKEKPLDSSYKLYQKKFLREYGAELSPEI